MASYNGFDQFVEDLAHGVHNFNTHTLKLFITNTAPVATNSVLVDLTEIAYTYVSENREIGLTSSAQTSGTYKLVITDEVLTASGGTVGPFRYVGVYNDTPTTPADPLICWYDYGSSITLNDGETITVNFDDSNGLFQIA